MGPAAEPPEGDAREVPLYALDADTEAAISRALHSAVPRLVPAGRDPLSDEIRSLLGAVDGRAFDPGQFATGLGRLATPGFSITVSTLP